jgi:sigma-B regulation protein RsbU (phosphoserine phosphatase)
MRCYLRVPMRYNPAFVAPMAIADRPLDAAAPISRMLVVDDDEDMRELLHAHLAGEGYQVATVPSGEASLGHLKEHATDIVFLDLEMVGMDGLETLRQIRQQGFDVAVILITAHGSEDVAIRALRSGADDYLRKPFTAEDLKAVVDRTAPRLSQGRQQQMEQQQLGDELSRAASIQSSLLPTECPVMDGWEFIAQCVPARAVGGDFYDWQRPAEDVLTMTVGDVMGKGMAAALLMSSVRAVLRAAAQELPPAAAVQAAASTLLSDLSRSGSFVTLFHARVDLTTGELRYVDAGHGHVFLAKANGDIQNLPASGLPIGVLDDEVYAEGVVTIEAGDVLVIHSDGLTQALPDIFRSGSTVPKSFASASSAAAIARDLITRATGTGSLGDDLTVGVLRRVPGFPLHVIPDPRLKGLIPTYLSRRWEDVTKITQELAGGGFRAIARIGHNLKGTGYGYGFGGIAEIGAALERAAEDQNAGEIRLQILALQDYLTRVRVAQT